MNNKLFWSSVLYMTVGLSIGTIAAIASADGQQLRTVLIANGITWTIGATAFYLIFGRQRRQ